MGGNSVDRGNEHDGIPGNDIEASCGRRMEV